jgi:class 3 adenylate cyclase
VRWAVDGEILISQRALAAIEDLLEAEPAGNLALKGFARPVTAYRVHSLKA